ncbi:MAG: hypothetical protein GKR88_16725 [Flavobacteriaceae bacterium]|nr:MAG: hypothetical protein GKR88_16725 [Flavobacteriaceae bacterium]
MIFNLHLLFLIIYTGHPSLDAYWGASNYKLVSSLEKLSSIDEVLAYEKQYGSSRFDPKASEKLLGFVRQYIQNWNQRLSKTSAFSVLKSPRFFLTYPNQKSLYPNEKIKKITIVQVTSIFQNNTYQEIRKRNIKDFIIYE